MLVRYAVLSIVTVHASTNFTSTPSTDADTTAGNFSAGTATPSYSYDPSGYFQASLRLCDSQQTTCNTRIYELPVSGTWASACDTLGDIQSTIIGGVSVQPFWYWVSDSSGQLGNEVEVTLYEDIYCGGNPVEYSQSYQGRFQATMDYDSGDPGWWLKVSHIVRSVRVTAVGQYNKGATKIGVKLVVFPLYNLDRQLGFMDEYDCVPGTGGYCDVGLESDTQHTWPSACASPIDRIYCIDRSPSDSNWGKLDDWPRYGFDFADNWQVPKAFKGRYPMGSA